MASSTPDPASRREARDEGRTPMPRRRSPRTVVALVGAAFIVGAAFVAVVLAEPTVGGEPTGADLTMAEEGWPSGHATARFPAPGSLVRDFALPRLRDQAPWTGPDTLRLSDHAGRWIYLDVFGTWCPPCRTKYPEMTEVAEQMEEKGAVVIGLLLEDDPETAATWLDANGGMSYPFVVLDDRTTRAWQLSGAPMGFLISPEGRIERKCYGCARGADAVELLPGLIR